MIKSQGFYHTPSPGRNLMSVYRAGLAHRVNHTVFHTSRNNKVLFIMKSFDNIRKRLTKNNKILKKKAITGLEILTEDSSPQISASEVTYNADSGNALIKFETVSGESEMTNLEILGWVLFSVCMVILAIPA